MVAGSIFFASFPLLEPSFAEVSLLELFFPELSALELMVSIYLLTGDDENGGIVLSVFQDDAGRRSGTVVIVTGGDDLCFSGYFFLSRAASPVPRYQKFRIYGI